MAGHSHWAGIKHRKGRADKERSKIFSKLSKEITIAAKQGAKDAEMNPRLRSAIQAAKVANMPKENIKRAISKSEMDSSINYESLKYEGFGPEKIAVIVETLTDNKNRTASSIRTIFQKFGGNLGESGVAAHYFNQLGIVRIEKKIISEDNIIEAAINAGADDCISKDLYHEVLIKKNDFYNVKVKLEKLNFAFISAKIEWIPINKVNIEDKEKSLKINNFLETLEDDDDVQNIYTNFNGI